MKINKSIAVNVLMISILISGCVIIRPGEAGVKQSIGKLSTDVKTQGSITYNPFISKVVIVSTRTNNLELSLSLPSKEGLSVQSQISILYKVEKDSLPQLIANLGLDYEPIISNVFRSTASDVCAQYFAKDMHSGLRSVIEDSILVTMNNLLLKNGLIVERVLMKSIQLPPGLTSSIEQKLQAEQDALRMKFVIDQEKLNAERKIIEAKGIRDAQLILSEGLTDQIIKLKQIEAMLKLSESSNAKIIVSEGKLPTLLNTP